MTATEDGVTDATLETKSHEALIVVLIVLAAALFSEGLSSIVIVIAVKVDQVMNFDTALLTDILLFHSSLCLILLFCTPAFSYYFVYRTETYKRRCAKVKDFGKKCKHSILPSRTN